MSQDLFRQIGEKLESLFKKSLHFFIVDKTHGEWQPVNFNFFWVTHFHHFVKNVFKGVSVFMLSYFEYRQIWLNTYQWTITT
jgi:hypothetical protein